MHAKLKRQNIVGHAEVGSSLSTMRIHHYGRHQSHTWPTPLRRAAAHGLVRRRSVRPAN